MLEFLKIESGIPRANAPAEPLVCLRDTDNQYHTCTLPEWKALVAQVDKELAKTLVVTTETKVIKTASLSNFIRLLEANDESRAADAFKTAINEGEFVLTRSQLTFSEDHLRKIITDKITSPEDPEDEVDDAEYYCDSIMIAILKLVPDFYEIEFTVDV